MDKLRPKQEEILKYTHGKMGVSAVPGSGKTWTLSLLAARIIASGELDDDQEVLVVTLVNSAVDNFNQRVAGFLKQWKQIPGIGYRVRTLHGLAHDIVRERPGLVGLSDRFQIIDDRETESIRNAVAEAWMRSHPDVIEGYLKPELREEKRASIRRGDLLNLVQSTANSFIRYAKDQRLTPDMLHSKLEALPVPLPLAQMGADIYADYQRSLAYRGGIDFDDLIRLALQAIESDPGYMERLRKRWPYILEDEAQDSSRLQEAILGALAGPGGNWVRVGDPNQAIYETFTTANPEYLRAFMDRPEVTSQELPNSGRSTCSVINLANYLVDWVQREHPREAVRNALHAPPWIEPTGKDDPQPNPPDDPSQIHLYLAKLTPDEEVALIARSLEAWLPDNPEATVAVLVPRNTRGFALVDELKKRQIPYEDALLRSSSSTRFSAGVLGNLLSYLAEPQSPTKLAKVYEVWRRGDREDGEAKARLQRTVKLLRKIPRVEDYIWPGAEHDWLREIDLAERDPLIHQQLLTFRSLIRRWQGAILLPVDQLVLTLSQDLLSDPAELAIAHKLANLLRQAAQAHPTWRLPELTEELAVIARNERRFLGFSSDDTGFDPDKHRGEVVIATMHKAKGLEWDRVYLTSVNTYDFPSGMPADQYISEKWFIRGSLNLEAEALAQLDALFASGEYEWYLEGIATQNARLDYVRERLRLLYVGITRARKELIITCNTGRNKQHGPTLALDELARFWESLLERSE